MHPVSAMINRRLIKKKMNRNANTAFEFVLKSWIDRINLKEE